MPKAKNNAREFSPQAIEPTRKVSEWLMSHADDPLTLVQDGRPYLREAMDEYLRVMNAEIEIAIRQLAIDDDVGAARSMKRIVRECRFVSSCNLMLENTNALWADMRAKADRDMQRAIKERAEQ